MAETLQLRTHDDEIALLISFEEEYQSWKEINPETAVAGWEWMRQEYFSECDDQEFTNLMLEADAVRQRMHEQFEEILHGNE